MKLRGTHSTRLDTLSRAGKIYLFSHRPCSTFDAPDVFFFFHHTGYRGGWIWHDWGRRSSFIYRKSLKTEILCKGMEWGREIAQIIHSYQAGERDSVKMESDRAWTLNMSSLTFIQYCMMHVMDTVNFQVTKSERREEWTLMNKLQTSDKLLARLLLPLALVS